MRTRSEPSFARRLAFVHAPLGSYEREASDTQPDLKGRTELVMVSQLMLTRHRFSLPAWVAAAAFMLAPAVLEAQEAAEPQTQPQAAEAGDATEPVVVFSLGSVSKLMEDVQYVTSAVGQPQAGGMFTMVAGTYTKGIDTTRPLAVVVPLVNGTPEPIALVPTPDVDTVLKNLEKQLGPADELDDGTKMILVGANSVFIRQIGDWAALARRPELLDLAPSDPAETLAAFGDEYDLALRLRMQRVPTQIRNMLVAQLRQGFQQAMEQQAGGQPEEARQVAEGTLGQLEQLLTETDELQFSWNVSPSAKQISLETSFTAVAGSDLASMYGGQKAIPSQFSWVIQEDAAGYYHAAASISPAVVEQTKQSMDNALSMVRQAIAREGDLSDQEQQDVNQLIDRLAQLTVDSLSEGKADAGALLRAGEGNLQFVFGSFVSDGDEAAQIVKDLAEKVKEKTDAPRFEFDRSTYEGVTMHLVEADVPEGEQEARKMFGETLRVHIGTAPNAVYVALGNDSAPLLQELIDAGEEDQVSGRPLGQVQIKLLPILRYAQSIEANDVIMAMIDALARAPDPGVVRVVSEGIPNGQTSEITIGEGLLQAVGAAIRWNQRMQMQKAQNGQF